MYRKDQIQSLAQLSLNFQDQLRVTEGGCPACELINDFVFAWESEIKNAEKFSGDFYDRIREIDQIIENLGEEDTVCFESKVLTHPNWDSIREAAEKAMQTLGLRVTEVPGWEDIGDGAKQRDWIKTEAPNK